MIIRSKNRINVVDRHVYDPSGRRTKTYIANAFDANIRDGQPDDTPNADTNNRRVIDRVFLDGTGLVRLRTENGTRTENDYDYRRRSIREKVQPYEGRDLYYERAYISNRLFYEEDPYNRRQYFAYRTSDVSLVRTVQGTHRDAELNSFGEVLNLARDAGSTNASFLITDYLHNSDGQVVETIDPNGNRQASSYDDRGRMVSETNAFGTTIESTTSYVHDEASNVVEIQHPRFTDSSDPHRQGCRTLYTYNGRDQQMTMTVAPNTSDQATETYSYYLDSRAKTTTDGRGHNWTTHWHDCCGRLLGNEDPLGNAVISNTDYEGRVTHRIVVSDFDPNGNSHNPPNNKTVREQTVRYDALNRVIAITNWLTPLGEVDPNDVPIAGLDGASAEDGLTTQMVYDLNVVDNIGLSGSNGQTIQKLGGGTYQVSIDEAIAQLDKSFNEGGATISFIANRAGSAQVMISPEEEVAVAINDSAGRTVFNGVLEPYDADNANQLITWSSIKPDRTVNVSHWDDNASHRALETVSIDALGETIKTRVDGSGRTLAVLDQLGEVTLSYFDSNGNLLELSDPNDNGFSLTYDELDRQVTVTDSEQSTSTIVYDLGGNSIEVTDARNNSSTSEFDSRGRRIKTTDQVNAETEYDYDANNNLLSVTDGENQQTSYQYDERNLQIGITYPDNATCSYDFDNANRLIYKTDLQGDTVTLTYDMADRLQQKDYRSAGNSPTGTIADKDVFTYDRASRVLTAECERYDNRVDMEYDNAGRLGNERLTIDGQSYNVGRDFNSRNDLVTLNYPDGSIVNRNYTERRNLMEVFYQRPDGSASFQVDGRSYDAAGRLTACTAGNDLQTTMSYFDDDQIESIELRNNSNQLLDSFDYTYDANKNVTNEIRSGVMSQYSWTSDSGFDPANRLVSWNQTDNSRQLAWNLSPVGNWETFTDNGDTESRSHGLAHELSSIDGNTLSYDSKGNITQNVNGHGYEWDFDNRLVSVDTSGNGNPNRRFKYDAFGRRVWIQNNVYVPAGEQMIARYGAGDAPSEPKNKWVYGDYIDEPIMIDRFRANNTSVPWMEMYYHHDRRFNVTALSWGSDATVRERYVYGPYGDTTILAGNGTTVRNNSSYQNPFMYTGRFWENTFGLYYFRNRWYDPELGRFINRDPLGYVDGMSLYRGYFVPSGVDPTGEFWSVLVTVAFAAVDTYDYATGKIGGAEYAGRMALNGAALAADAMTGGMGGGVALRGAALAGRVGRAASVAVRGAKAASVATIGFDRTVKVMHGADVARKGIQLAGGAYRGYTTLHGAGQAYAGVSNIIAQVQSDEECSIGTVSRTAFDTFRTGYGTAQSGYGLFQSYRTFRGLVAGRLNLGSGHNPMSNAVNVDPKPNYFWLGRRTDVVGNSNNLPLRTGSMNEVHSINPHRFYPMAGDTARVMSPGSKLFVTGNPVKNKYYKATVKMTSDGSSSFSHESTGPVISSHQFGTQTHTSGRPLKGLSESTTLTRN